MGVLSKLKSRMSSYRGPTQVDPTKSSPVYGFDTGRAINSGVNAVNAGLAAGSNQAPIQSNTAQDIADLGSAIGQAIGVAYGEDKKEKRPKIKSSNTLKSDGYSTNLVGSVPTEKINTGIKSPFGITTAKDELNKIKVDLPTQMLESKK